MRKNGFAPILIILIIAVLGVVGYFGYKNYYSKSSTPVSSSALSLSPTPSPSNVRLEASARVGHGFLSGNENKNGEQVYISDKLGIKLVYDVPNTGPVKEIGNKIYADYRKNSDGSISGQYVEVFSKLPNQTLSDGIKANILGNYSMDKCEVKVTQSQGTESIAEITDKTWSVGGEQGPYCPVNYISNAGGLAFFYYDSGHPQSFLFYSIGQYVPWWYAEFTK